MNVCLNDFSFPKSKQQLQMLCQRHLLVTEYLRRNHLNLTENVSIFSALTFSVGFAVAAML